MSDLNDVLSRIDAEREQTLAEFVQLLEIPSISSDPAGSAGIAEAADWLKKKLSGMGFDVRVVVTEGHPLILAHSSAEDEGRGPRMLFYGHYDVQPVGEEDQWTYPPFKPTLVKEGDITRIYARGASDSKSQLWSFIETLRCWHLVHGCFPGPVTILLEGEEESGSASLPAFIETHKEDLACDVAFICDSDMWSPTQPAVTTQLKGLLHEKVTLHAPNPDMHSGYFGNVAANPIRILSGLLSALHDEEGRVAIDGFYDDVKDIPVALREQWQSLSRASYHLESADLRGGIVENGYTPLEAIWGRPALDINGITGGNQGPGERSVLPASATARISFRLVAGQEPATVRNRFRDFIRLRIPEGCRVEFEGGEGSRALAMSPENPFVQAVSRGMEREWRTRTILKGSGGSIPLAEMFSDVLGIDCIVLGFILASDAIHAPDEHYDTERLHRSIRSWAYILDEIQSMRE
ncbi:M20/M25/M40 family metallo-hydrolase [Notoacmeibacter sp. MSK16QG-6]|uniref:M20/M25/M40 family metallo-hydrolase n=1 Tax=Notoacmeibacter sp. MSK16QG-6 TaxID=2957982 RepID=UPI00209DB2F2|nr:M20/M25/M40 family metallo-hydrolase [Notoacmeibacter sp. MSK16QG-6]MCP1200532.1 M20/M25/M40 family metallo-hydrolase [Notoacmeibacter sp. MSK16QG-6]